MGEDEPAPHPLLEGIIENVSSDNASTEIRNASGEITAIGLNMTSTHVTLLVEDGKRGTTEKHLEYPGSLPLDTEGHWVRIYEAQLVVYGRRRTQDSTRDRNFPTPSTRLKIHDVDTNTWYPPNQTSFSL